MRSVLAAGRGALGMSALRSTEDRRVLEQVILPAYAGRAPGQRVLFVGCATYTQPYAQRFAAHEYWTIDPVSSQARYGSARHIVDSLQNLGSHVEDEYFDIIICNGVLGWGLNLLEDADAAFTACHRHLRVDGEFLLGWNNVWPRSRVLPDQIPALRRFAPQLFRPLQTAVLTVDAPNRHVFSFYLK